MTAPANDPTGAGIYGKGGVTGAMNRATAAMRALKVAFGGLSTVGQRDHMAEALAADRRSMAAGLWSMADCLFVGWDVWWFLRILEVI